ncbi:MAG: hypothetical protein CM1200mP34_2340 [Verrucomicrobiales bacterium]|nr:MAG: hypothetical protein CM1200mP34_2340 [Verrucomicrobiales bacterium]
MRSTCGIIPGQIVAGGENHRVRVEHGAVGLFKRDSHLGSGTGFARPCSKAGFGPRIAGR